MTGRDSISTGRSTASMSRWSTNGMIAALIAGLAARRRAGARTRCCFTTPITAWSARRDQMERLDLDGFDGVLAFGEALSEAYRRRGWGRRVFTWHEAADLNGVPGLPGARIERDLLWIGNWGDDERAAELHEFLIEPVTALGLRARVHGVRYPARGASRARGGRHRLCWLSRQFPGAAGLCRGAR